MQSSITIAGLGYATPDGRQLFQNIDLGFGPERTGLVGRNGVGKSTLLRLIAGDLRPREGTIAMTGTVGVLRQDPHGRPGATVADLFGIAAGLDLLRRADAGRATADEIAEADWTLEGRLGEALARVGLSADAATPLDALSGGQRTRAALAALVFAEPDFLLLDEPTNNLDRAGRASVQVLLAGWRKGAIIVSHDRELLDGMAAIVELTSLAATRYGGGYTAYRERKALELAAAERELADAERRVGHAAETAADRAQRQAQRDRRGRQREAKGDLPRLLAGLRKNAAEATAGAGARLAERQATEAASDAAEARARIEVLVPLTVAVPPTGLSAARTVLALDGVSAGYEPGRAVISGFGLAITGPERVAITGENGTGKTTLLDLVTGRLAPWSGTVSVGVPFALLDQRVGILDPALTVRDNFRRLNPDSDENACRASLARFMFRADAALQGAGTLSGGQLLRAGLACVLGAVPPKLLVLDEPTNHLDLDSIEAVEAGLRGYDGALLVVSHDERFLDGIGITRRVELTRHR